MSLTFGELFAGVSGMGQGLVEAGWQPRWMVEWDRGNGVASPVARWVVEQINRAYPQQASSPLFALLDDLARRKAA